MNTPVYEYTLTKTDFVAAQSLYRRQNRLAAIGYYFWIWLVPALGAVVALITLTAYLLHQQELLYSLAPAAAMGLWFAIFIPVMRWWQIRKLWKCSSEAVGGGKPVTLQFDQTQLVSAIPGRSEGRFLWNAFRDFVEDERIALLFIQKKQFLYIPKASLPESAWQQIRGFAPRKKK